MKMLKNKDKMFLFMLFIVSVLEIIISICEVFFPKLLVESTSRNDTNVNIIIIFTLCFVIAYFFKNYLNTKIDASIRVSQVEYTWDIYIKSLECDYMLMESRDGQMTYQKALDTVMQGDRGILRTMMPWVTEVCIGILGIGAYSYILCKLNIILVIALILISILSLYISRYLVIYENKNKDKWTQYEKEIMYFNNKGSDLSYGIDIRLFSMQDFIKKCKSESIYNRVKWIKKVGIKRCFIENINNIIFIARDLATYIFLIFLYKDNYIDLADFVLYIGIVANFSNWVGKVFNNCINISSYSILVDDFKKFMDIDKYSDDNKDIFDEEIEKIEFRNVSFAHENSYILKDFNLTINKGEKIGLVGLNGAGKTTIVKLMCGLYRAETGQILINNKNINDIRLDSLTKQYATVFQDANVFPLSIGENIAMSKNYDEEKVRMAINKVKLDKNIDKTYGRIDSQMTKAIYEEGVVLSGGQVQKLLFARALYKEGNVVILDEPTAALDPIAERELYLLYKEYCKDKIALFISHRLASTEFCDKIAYIEDGKVVEFGKHEELLNMKGKYNSLFNIQKKYYV